MNNIAGRIGWDSSSSIHKIEFERKPVLEDISIVIPTLGRPILEQSLYWVLNGNAWPGCLVVVEQGASRDVAAWLIRVQQAGVRVTHIISNQHGRSAGINRGLEQVDTPFVAITDDDCFVEADWLSEMVKELRRHPYEVITGRVKAEGADMIVVVTAATPSLQKHPRIKFDSMSGGNMGASLTVFRKVGLFEEDPVMSTAEDAEWAYRALRKGVRIRYQPEVVVSHFGWRNLEKRLDQYRHYALSHGGFYGKYLRKIDLFILMRAMVHWLRALRRWITGRLRGDLDYAWIGRAYCLNLLPGIIAGIRSKTEPEDLK